MDKFETGNVVELNSGSPWMTVGEITDEKVTLHYWSEQGDMFGILETTPAKSKLFKRISEK